MPQPTGDSSHSDAQSTDVLPADTHVETEEELAYANRPFRGWLLLGVIGIVVVVLALISAFVDWWFIGPLEGRVF